LFCGRPLYSEGICILALFPSAGHKSAGGQHSGLLAERPGSLSRDEGRRVRSIPISQKGNGCHAERRDRPVKNQPRVVAGQISARRQIGLEIS
jgi:hypothetical protein